MQPETFEKIKKRLIEHEGIRLKPYRCGAGKLTIGVGRNLEDRGISQEEALYLLKNDIELSEKECQSAFPFYESLDEQRQSVLLEMCFNLGMPRLKGFRMMLEALAYHDYSRASDEMLNSRWARQVGNRALRLAGMIRGSQRTNH